MNVNALYRNVRVEITIKKKGREKKIKLDNFMMEVGEWLFRAKGKKTVLRFWDERKRFIPEPHGSPGIVQLSPRGGNFPPGTFHRGLSTAQFGQCLAW